VAGGPMRERVAPPDVESVQGGPGLRRVPPDVTSSDEP